MEKKMTAGQKLKELFDAGTGPSYVRQWDNSERANDVCLDGTWDLEEIANKLIEWSANK